MHLVASGFSYTRFAVTPLVGTASPIFFIKGGCALYPSAQGTASPIFFYLDLFCVDF